MRINQFSIDVAQQRAVLGFTDDNSNLAHATYGNVQLPIQAKPGETIQEAEHEAREGAAKALEEVASALRSYTR